MELMEVYAISISKDIYGSHEVNLIFVHSCQ